MHFNLQLGSYWFCSPYFYRLVVTWGSSIVSTIVTLWGKVALQDDWDASQPVVTLTRSLKERPVKASSFSSGYSHWRGNSRQETFHVSGGLWLILVNSCSVLLAIWYCRCPALCQWRVLPIPTDILQWLLHSGVWTCWTAAEYHWWNIQGTFGK